MPEPPLVLSREVLGRPQPPCQSAHDEECKLGRRFGEYIGGIRERNLAAVGVRAIDVVETHRQLGDNLQCSLARLEHLSVNLITECRNKAVNACPDLLQNQ